MASRRPTASIVIPVWNEWTMTRGCLDSLRPTLGVRDEVIVVDNGSRDATPGGLRSFQWAKVITNEENRGFAAACNQGLAASKNEIVVFLNNDTLVTPRWLDGLLAPFEDESVGATGPRSNMVSGDQLVENPEYLTGKMQDLRRFAKEWAMAHRGQTTEVIRLVGFCLAVRADVGKAIGGFDEGFGIGGFEDDDLCRRLRNQGLRLLIAHESFIHHHGHATFDANGLDWFAIQNENKNRFVTKHSTGPGGGNRSMLLSAALIVKDEESLLPTCLASLQGLVDEIVVYDTGSTDNTIAVAEAAGAKVIEGYWDDDFARARNAALEHCRGEWVLSIDADEVVQTKPKKLRQLIESAVVDAGAIEIDNLAGDEGSDHVAVSHRAVRLFRRDRGHWQFRLHEQVVARPGLPALSIGDVDGLRLIHSGYLNQAVADRDKMARNIRIAEADLDTDEHSPADRATKVLSLGRSLILAGRHEEAFERFAEAVAEPDCLPVQRRTALRNGAEVLMALGRIEEALSWIDDLREVSNDDVMTDYLEGTARLLMGDPEAAAPLLEGIEHLRAEDGVAYAASSLLAKKGFIRTARGDWEAAADALLEAADDPTLLEPIWSPLVESHLQAGRSLDPVIDRVPPNRLVHVLGQMVIAPPDSADVFAEQLWDDFSGDPRLLAFAIRLAPKLAPTRALEWSARLRSAGVFADDPLIAIAGDPERPAPDRLTAAAIAHAAFRDPRARERLTAIAAAVDEADLVRVLTELAELAADLLPNFVEGASTSATRTVAVADALAALGATEQAELVRAYAAERWGETAPR